MSEFARGDQLPPTQDDEPPPMPAVMEVDNDNMSAAAASPNDLKRPRSPSPPGEVQPSVRSKLKPNTNIASSVNPVAGSSHAIINPTSVSPTSETEETTPATMNITPSHNPSKEIRTVVCFSSLKGDKCFTHPGNLSRAIYSSIFEKKVFGETIQVTGGGQGVRFEVANLDNLPQTPESVCRLGDWPVRCWVVDPDPANNYSFGRIYPVSTTMTEDELMSKLTVLGGSTTRLTSVFRLPGTQADGTKGPTLGVRLKFKGPLPAKVAIGGISYVVRSHNLPVLQCFRCLSYGHGQSSCRGKLRCHTCSGYHSQSDCSRDPMCLYCGGGHRPTSRLCPAYQKAQAITKEQQENKLPIPEARQKLREIRPGSHRPAAVPVPTPQPPAPVMSVYMRTGNMPPTSYAQAATPNPTAHIQPAMPQSQPLKHNQSTLPPQPTDATTSTPPPQPTDATITLPLSAETTEQGDNHTASADSATAPHPHHHTPPRSVRPKTTRSSPKSPRPKRQHTETDLGIVPLPVTETPDTQIPPPPAYAPPPIPPGRPIPLLPPPGLPPPQHSSEHSAPFQSSAQASTTATQQTNNSSWTSLLSGLATIAFNLFTHLASGLSFQDCLSKILPSIFNLLSSLST